MSTFVASGLTARKFNPLVVGVVGLVFGLASGYLIGDRHHSSYTPSELDGGVERITVIEPGAGIPDEAPPRSATHIKVSPQRPAPGTKPVWVVVMEKDGNTTQYVGTADE